MDARPREYPAAGTLPAAPPSGPALIARGGAPLLLQGVLAGPLYLVLGLGQALVRDGFDLRRHSLSVLANGAGGWVQTANFVIVGAMVVAAAVGIRRALRPRGGPGAWLLGAFGASMLLAAAFRADPVDGFPPGTPEGFPTGVSTTGLLHFAAGGLGLLALAASGVALGVALLRLGDRLAGILSIVTGVIVVAGFFAPMILPAAGPVAGIWLAVVAGWTWLAWLCLHLRR